ncbi:MAG: hypothetical protein HYV07_11020 [Deltaproteobacteria bacterium]|nr:hypothetical protein [Deltaproteobacteria bacterium]
MKTTGLARAFAVGVVAAFLAGPTAAETPGDSARRLVAEGERLGKAKEYELALERFLEAERLAASPTHDCWIAVAQTRLGRLTEAKLHLDRCAKRSESERVPLVPWFEKAQKELGRLVDGGAYARVHVRTDPERSVTLWVRGLDFELSTPAELVLPLGPHEITARAPGYVPEQLSFVLRTKDPYPVFLRMSREPPSVEAVQPPPGAPTPLALSQPKARSSTVTSLELSPDQRPASSPLPLVLLAGGGSSLVGAIVFHAIAASARARAQDPANDYDAEISALESGRAITLTLYAVSAVALGIGAALWFGGDE